MRRSDREITDRDEILEIVRRCGVCRVALNDDGYPYVIPLNFGFRSDGAGLELVFHSAAEGRKLELIARDNRVSFEMDCGHELQYSEAKGYCTMAYESVTGRGRISILPDEEKADALQAIMDHYHPEGGSFYNPAAIPRTCVYVLKVESIIGKRKTARP